MNGKNEHLQASGIERDKNQRIAARDLLLIGLLLLAGIVSMASIRIGMRRDGSSVQVTIDGDIYGTYPLDQSDSQTIPITIDGRVTNTLQLEDGAAKMVSADCPDQICVHHKEVSRQGETIVCLPNRVVVEVRGAEKSELDSVAR